MRNERRVYVGFSRIGSIAHTSTFSHIGGFASIILISAVLLAGCVDTEPLETDYANITPPLTQQEYETQLINLLILQQDLTTEMSQEQVDSTRLAFFEAQGWSWGAFDSTHKHHESFPSRQAERSERLSTEVRALMDSISTEIRTRKYDLER
ncbi:MAG: hypothetical protein O2991_01290 [Bacteroidetes bacterium]|nr:hypothetical protein [Bacteroidota bacterium]MDA0907094.1 hypothetical protein [Bacteroidota bacterium]